MKSLLQDFMKKHSNWENILTKEPYNLTVNRRDGYVMLNYNDKTSDFYFPIVREARGIIFDEKTLNVACFPFSKIFNMNEEYAPEIDWKSARVAEMKDGHLVNLWFYRGMWRLSTISDIDAFSVQIERDEEIEKQVKDVIPKNVDNLGKLFMRVFDSDFFSRLDENFTYMFELVSPYTKNIIPYDFTKIYHIGTRDKRTGNEIEINIGIEKTRIIEKFSPKRIERIAKNIFEDSKGIVVRDKDYNRISIKTPRYLHALNYKFANNSEIAILESIMQGNTKYFLSYYPEYFERVKTIKREYDLVRNRLKCAQEKCDRMMARNVSRRKIAMYIKSAVPEYRTYMFWYIDGVRNNYEEYLQEIGAKSIIERMNKRVREKLSNEV